MAKSRKSDQGKPVRKKVVYVSADVHRRLKMGAAEAQLSIGEFIMHMLGVVGA